MTKMNNVKNNIKKKNMRTHTYTWSLINRMKRKVLYFLLVEYIFVRFRWFEFKIVLTNKVLSVLYYVFYEYCNFYEKIPILSLRTLSKLYVFFFF